MRAVVTGVWCVTPIDHSVQEFWSNLVRLALANGFGFGGHNGVAAFKQFEEA